MRGLSLLQGETTMLHYRIYLLNVHGKITSPAIDWEGEDDNAAFIFVGELQADCAAVEIWQAARCVAKIDRNATISNGEPSCA